MQNQTAKAKETPKNGTTTTNGTAKAVNGTATSTAVAVIEKPTEKKAEQQPKVLSFEERKERSERLYDLFERHTKLKDHANELLGIVRADESVNTSFKLNSSNGQTWQTTNQEFIKKTVKVMHEAILAKIEEVETEIELIQIG